MPSHIPQGRWEMSSSNHRPLPPRKFPLGADSQRGALRSTYKPPLLSGEEMVTQYPTQQAHRAYSTSQAGYQFSGQKMTGGHIPTKQEMEDRNLEIMRSRVKHLGYVFMDIPVDAAHEERIARMRQQEDELADALGRAHPRGQASPQSPSASEDAGPAPRYSPPEEMNSGALVQHNPGEDPYVSNPCHQLMNIFSTSQGKMLTYPVTLDTGTPDNWIDEDMLEILGVEPKREAVADEFLDFCGKTVKSSVTVVISWSSARGNRKVREDTFRVAQSAPFNAILGSNFIFSEGILVFNKTAWVLGKKNPTKEEKDYTAKQREIAIKETKELAVRRKEQASKSQSGSGQKKPSVTRK